METVTFNTPRYNLPGQTNMVNLDTNRNNQVLPYTKDEKSIFLRKTKVPTIVTTSCNKVIREVKQIGRLDTEAQSRDTQ